MQVKMTLPLKMKELPEHQRIAILDELRKALQVAIPTPLQLIAKDGPNLPKMPELEGKNGLKPSSGLGGPTLPKEHSIWALNDEPLLADAEEELYQELVGPAFENMASLIAALGLADEHVDITKSIDPDYLAFEEELIKGNKVTNKLMDLWKVAKQKRKDFLKYIQGQSNWSKERLKAIDNILKQDLPDYEKTAEKYAVRAAFIAKIRNKTNTEALKTVGAYVDRFPSTIEVAKHEGIQLTTSETSEHRVINNMSLTVTEEELEEALKEAREKRNVAMHSYKILPLQPQEIATVENATLRAAEKITEVTDKQRAGIKQIVLQAVNGRWSAQQLAQILFKKFGELNHDFRRIAITELAMASNDAFLAGCTEGDQVMVPAVEGSCKWCKKYLEGKSFTVTHNINLMGNNYNDEMTYMWVGKSNYQRSQATWIPCAPLHPNCRHYPIKLSRFYHMIDGKATLKPLKDLINEERARRGLPPDPNLK